MKNYTLFVLLSLSVSQCNTKHLSLANSTDKLVEMSKSPCFGYCPTYDLTIFQNGTMKLNAKQNMKKSGVFIMQLSKNELKKLKKELLDLKLDSYLDEYKEAIADAPSTRITYYGDNVKKSIFTNFNYPEPLQQFAVKLDTLATNNSWEVYTDHRISQEYIVHLKESKTLHDFLVRFKEQELIPVKRLDPVTGQYWLVSARILPDQKDKFLSLLKKDMDVQSAQLNKAVEMR